MKMRNCYSKLTEIHDTGRSINNQLFDQTVHNWKAAPLKNTEALPKICFSLQYKLIVILYQAPISADSPR